jgi:succinyl-CoA synthetase beta subunit
VAAVRPLVEATGNPVVVVKSQIHAGGRGKGRFKEHPDTGGVNVVTRRDRGGSRPPRPGARAGRPDARLDSGHHPDRRRGQAGQPLYIEQGIDIERELYLSILFDRAVSRNIVMASTEGGMEIEKVAEETPEKILREVIDPAIGLADFQANRLALGLGLRRTPPRTSSVREGAGRCAMELDTDLIEINPLVVTTRAR